MSSRVTICCDKCHKEIPTAKGFHLTADAGIGSTSFKPGDYCISCLAEMCGEKLMTKEVKQQVETWNEAKWREIDEERSRNHDW